jgi:hypothetical protein
MIRRIITIAAALVALATSTQSVAAQSDIIRGRVTDVNGEPLSSVRVTATSIPGNVTREATTNQQGNFQIVFPNGTGDYIMGYAGFGFNFRQFQIKRLTDEPVLVADTRLQPVQLDTLAVTASVQQRVNRNQPVQDVSGTEKPITPDQVALELQGNLAAMAASLPGVLLLPGIDGGPDGFSVLGLGADENSITLNGLQGGANNLPRDAAVSTSLSTSPYDVSRGGFSGGNFNVTSRPGSNYSRRGLSLQMTSPQVQWTDRAASSLGNDYTQLSLGGSASGPLKFNKAFYNMSAQFGRTSRDNQTLLGTDDLGLRTAGVASDSVSRFVGILQGYGIPVVAADERSNRINDSGTLFGSVDLSPPSSTSGASYNLTVNGNWNKTSPAGTSFGFGSVPQLSSVGGESFNWGGGVQARHSAYVKMLLSETQVGVNLSRQDSDPYVQLPGGRVRVSSSFDEGDNSVTNLSFGGNQNLSNATKTTTANFQNNLSWFDNDNKHRIKLTTELQFSGNTSHESSNLLGTFSFNSLADLEAGRPASFSRTLTARERTTGQMRGSLAIGDTYRRTADLQFQYGIRVDASRYTKTPAYNSLVESTFGVRNDRAPTPIAISPRIGFSWTLGQSQEIAAFAGAVRGPRAVVRGGIGVYANSSSPMLLRSALDNTGLPSGTQQIVCVGPAVPIPDWTAYGNDPDLVPEQCADGSGGTVFANSAPNVTLYSSDYAPQKNVRANLSWSGSILDARFTLNAEGTYSLNLNRERQFDLNFDPRQRFTLADDGRPVFVEPTSIVASTGVIASRDARTSSSFARVTEMRSDMRSRTAQLSLRLNPIYRTPAKLRWNLAYTYQNVREQVSGFNSTAGDPRTVDWAASAQGPHSINYSLSYNFFNAVSVSLSGSVRSGSAFTPTVAGDINGDGWSNDRAFIFSSSSGDPAVADGMAQLLANASGRTRSCLESQLGRIAERSSCRGPWTVGNHSLNISLDRAKFRMPHRGDVSFSISNPLYAADLLVNGSSGIKGWGQSPAIDNSLLYVRGFDAQTKQYKYEVNQRFGATRPQLLGVRAPAMVTAMVRFDLGPTRERQQLDQQLRFSRPQGEPRLAESMFRSMGNSGVPNPMSTILRQQDSLKLTAMQADSIASMNRRYMYRADSLWTPVARTLSVLPQKFDLDGAYDNFIEARRTQINLLTNVAVATRELLTPEQRRKLPASVINMMDPRYLALMRHGNSMFLGAGSAFIGAPMGMEMMMSEGVIFRTVTPF